MSSMDRGLNELLKWSIENASTTTNDPDAAPPENRGLNADALAALFGGPSEADLMKAAMAVIMARDDGDSNTTTTLDDKLVAFDNLEQLVESLDNANLLERLSLWTPLLGVLESEEPDLRRMAAWCIGTAVQNNRATQERLVALGGIPRLVALAAGAGEPAAVRRKAIYALSSACRNYQPALDAYLAALPAAHRGRGGGDREGDLPPVDATDMDAVDAVFSSLKADYQAAEAAEAAKKAAPAAAADTTS
ncbi:hsp70 nucleotide exchange factor [Niveomyces insectorum RCEF 264]|uniref:Hsp70 nucleotide exchange factor n=1 Tax=Niveomyces insectorum RCEF 264 TaxID=1081102 RepID=A0A167ULV9_9HYPO|nr:hsp70 nucleotide exchange factor [Niveomyces insectorum RCEF 264]